MSSTADSRRSFLKQTGSLAATGAAIQLAGAGAYGANERFRVATIGTGGQGQAHVRAWASKDDVDVAYVCDVDDKRASEAAQRADGARAVSDLRVVLDDPDVDAVSIATPDHWHTPAALLALDAGKHVYVEKPCSHNIREGRMLVEAQERTGLVVQHGTQTRSSAGHMEAVQMLRDGVIGDVLVARAWDIQFRSNIGRMEPSDPPEGFDYDTWSLQKLFPGVTGGPMWVKAVSSALPFLSINPTSGVDLDNAGEYLKNGAASVGLVAPLFDQAAIAAGDFDKIAQNAAKVMANVREAGPYQRKK